MTPGHALQTAMVGRLRADAAMTALLAAGEIADPPRPGADYPYVTFGRTSGFDWSAGTESGREVFLTLHVWSQASGRSEVSAIVERIGALVDAGDLPLQGHELILLERQYDEIRYDAEASLYRGLIRYRALVEESAAD